MLPMFPSKLYVDRFQLRPIMAGKRVRNRLEAR